MPRNDDDLPAVALTLRSLAAGHEVDLRPGDAIASAATAADEVAELERRFAQLTGGSRQPARRPELELLITDVSAQRLRVRAESVRLKRLAVIALASDDDRARGFSLEEVLDRYRAVAEQSARLSDLINALRLRLD